jgi:histidinol-phosphate aminotransferase
VNSQFDDPRIRLVPSHIESLVAYSPGPSPEEIRRLYGVEQVAELANNENPLGPSPLAIRAMQAHLFESHRYSNGGFDLQRTLALKHGLEVGNVIVGSGSEGILLGILRAFLCDEDEVLTTEAAFVGFQILARSCRAKYRTVPYRNWHYDLQAIAGAVSERTKIIYLANPNNPTGTIFSREAFEEFYRRVPEHTLVIMDEAYYEYAVANPLYPDSLKYGFPNVITLRTFSKIYGLAGLRVGYGFAHERLAANVLKVKLAFEPNALAQVAAIGALRDDAFIKRSVGHNSRARAFLTESLQRLALTVVPSEANFIMVVLADENHAAGVSHRLLESGVMVRYLKGTGLPNCVRITVGTDEENRLCVDALTRIIHERGGGGLK